MLIQQFVDKCGGVFHTARWSLHLCLGSQDSLTNKKERPIINNDVSTQGFCLFISLFLFAFKLDPKIS